MAENDLIIKIKVDSRDILNGMDDSLNKINKSMKNIDGIDEFKNDLEEARDSISNINKKILELDDKASSESVKRLSKSIHNYSQKISDTRKNIMAMNEQFEGKIKASGLDDVIKKLELLDGYIKDLNNLGLENIGSNRDKSIDILVKSLESIDGLSKKIKSNKLVDVGEIQNANERIKELKQQFDEDSKSYYRVGENKNELGGNEV